nr:SDR family oxidoreductase [Actinomycetota bacterium]
GRDNSVVTADTVDAQYLVDARGGALMISAFAQLHRSRRAAWGRIVSLTSGGPMGFPGEASYGAAKAALENYTMTASIELAASGITANVVYPPVTDTGWVTDEVRAFVAQSSDHWHVAEPADVAGVIAWLCTDAARMVTGNVIRMR